MDPQWLPWCWAAGAAGCAGVFFAVQPWRAEFRGGFDLVRKYPAAWAVPAGLLVLEAVASGWGGRMPHFSGEPGARWTAGAMLQAGQGLAFGPAVALLSGLLLAANVAGLRRGFLKGVESVMGGGGQGLLALLFAGVAALVADTMLAEHGVPMVWHAVVTVVAVPLMGWAPAAVLAGLLLLAETEVRAPKKVGEVRWLESAAAHSARLWPWALAHGLAWWLGRWLPVEAAVVGQWVLAAAGLVLVFAPLVFLHVKQAPGWRSGAGQALGLWRTRGGQPLAWLAVAGLGFFLWFLAGQGLAGLSAGGPDWLRIGLASGHALVQIGLTVVALSAWVNLRLAGEPPPARPRRPARG